MNTKSYRNITSWMVSAFLLFVVALFPATEAYAQNGSLTGVITDENTGETLPGANIMITELEMGAATDIDGQYTITNVPAGTYTLRINFVGYTTKETTIEIADGEEATADFALRSDVLRMDQVVVSAAGAGTSRREIGSSIGSIDADELVGRNNIQNMSQMLQGRVAGLNVLPGGGQAGQGSRITLRGLASLSQANTPIIYVDGVRMDNSTASGIRTTGPSWSGLDDLNPQDIQNIEVVRGASAATMYGTEAAAGVIQITTRRGEEGDARWSFSSEYGINRAPDSWWNDSGSVYSQWFADEFSRTGVQSRNSLSVSGGQETWRYYVAGTVRNNEGILPNNSEDYQSLRSNLNITPFERLEIGVNLSYSRRVVQQQPDGNNQEGLTINGLVGGPDGQFNPTVNTLELDHFLRGNRFTTGLNFEFRQRDNLTHRLRLGGEFFNADNTEFLPPNIIPRFDGGYKGNYRRNSTNFNLDYITTYRTQLTDNIRSTSNIGFQAFDRSTDSNNSYGEDFPFLGLSTVSATSANFSVSETRFEERSYGLFGEQQFAFSDMFYVTVGARADAHSAFGDSADLQFYPKIDASYLISEHSFWNNDIGSLRLRGSYGTAGMQPGAFDAVRTWSPISAIGAVPAVTPGNVGNPDLRPEVSHEYEAGFEFSTLSDRLNIDFTYYNQRTKDALHSRGLPPSLGFTGTQLENIGEVANHGIELSVNATVYESQSMAVNLTGNYGYNSNEVISLGEGRPLNPRWTQYIAEGYPIAGFFGDYIVENDAGEAVPYSSTVDLPDGLPNDLPYIGPSIPVHTAQFGGNVDLAFGLSMNILFDYQGGHYRQDHTARWLVDPRRNLSDDVQVDGQTIATAGPVHEQCRGDNLDPVQSALCTTNSGINEGDFVVPADFLKLRELSFTYQIPNYLVEGFGINSASVNFAGRNLWRWMKSPGTEPESNLSSASTFQRHDYFTTPTPQQFVVGLNVQF